MKAFVRPPLPGGSIQFHSLQSLSRSVSRHISRTLTKIIVCMRAIWQRRYVMRFLNSVLSLLPLRFVSSLLEEPEVAVIGAGRGPAGSIIHKLFVSAQRAALLAPLDEEAGRVGGPDDRKPAGGGVPDFPPPAGREILLRTCVPRPAPYSKALPQRLFCVLLREDFRLAGAFSSDTSFFWGEPLEEPRWKLRTLWMFLNAYVFWVGGVFKLPWRTNEETRLPWS